MRTAHLGYLAMLWGLGLADGAAAQELLISNARVIVGNGEVIERATIVIERGRIASVSAEPVADAASPVLDAQGLTAMPGFVDAHRQLISGDPDAWTAQAADAMREYAEAGFTTVLSLGDALEHIVALRERLDTREIAGPRLVVSGPIRLTADDGDSLPDATLREAVRALTLAGADAIHAVLESPDGGEIEALLITKDEADQQGLLTLTDAAAVQAALAAVRGGSGYLIRTPRLGGLDEDAARALVEAGADNAEFGLVTTSALGASTGAEAGPAGPANARQLREAGVILAFGTGSERAPRDALRHELTFLESVFSNAAIIDILTRSAAFAVRRDDALGTLEPGKIGDVVLLEGDPLTELDALLNVRVVVRTGRIIVDNR